MLANVVSWARLVIEQYFIFTGTGRPSDRDCLLHRQLPDAVWDNLRNFFQQLSNLPCWIDTGLSTTVFGPKQNLNYWEKVFGTGKAPNGMQILAEPLNLNQMIQKR